MVTLYRGGAYPNLSLQDLDDVRLVRAGRAGGAVRRRYNNFVYPRLISTSRSCAYENGQAIKSDFPKWATKGIEDGELVFAAGHPGSTDRRDTVAQIVFDRDVRYPLMLATATRQRKILQEYSAASPESKRRAAHNLDGTENWLKSITGEYKALRAPELLTALDSPSYRNRRLLVPALAHVLGLGTGSR
jgi:hypothetical protein